MIEELPDLPSKICRLRSRTVGRKDESEMDIRELKSAVERHFLNCTLRVRRDQQLLLPPRCKRQDLIS